MNNPLVTIICTNYNQGKFLAEALNSVLDQTYRNFELFIIDNNSNDDSEAIIRHYKRLHPEIEIFLLEENIGICKAFNLGLKAASGKYIIDLAADDVLFSDRLKLQVEALEKLDETYTMCFTDAVHIDEKGKILRNHYKRRGNSILVEKVPTGDVYQNILERFFICTPTMMMRTSHLIEMNGYDETISYEDFDYWVRFSRKYKFHFLNKVLTAKRNVEKSHNSKSKELKYEKYHLDTLSICKKAYKLNTTKKEHIALAKRVKYEMRQSYFTMNYDVTLSYSKLLKKLGIFKTPDIIIASLARKKINLSGIYNKLKSVKGSI